MLVEVIVFSKVLLLWALWPFPIVLVHPEYIGGASAQTVFNVGGKLLIPPPRLQFSGEAQKCHLCSV